MEHILSKFCRATCFHEYTLTRFNICPGIDSPWMFTAPCDKHRDYRQYLLKTAGDYPASTKPLYNVVTTLPQGSKDVIKTLNFCTTLRKRCTKVVLMFSKGSYNVTTRIIVVENFDITLLQRCWKIIAWLNYKNPYKTFIQRKLKVIHFRQSETPYIPFL